MGKLNLTAMKKQREAQEVEAPVSEALEQSYAGVWGSDKEKVERIELNRIHAFEDTKGREQPFRTSKDKVEQIKLSAADIGIVTPLIVRKLGNDYQIISGHHRFMAAQELNMLTVPCVVRDISDEEAVKYAVECNIQRSKLLPTEYAEIYARYMELRHDIDMTAGEIADKFGISRKSLYRYIKILDLSNNLRQLIDDDKIHTDTAEIFCEFSEVNQNKVCEFVEQTNKKINRALAKEMQAVVATLGDDVTVTDFIELVEKPKRTFKSKIYTEMAKRYNVDNTEAEWDALVTQLLDDYYKELS